MAESDQTRLHVAAANSHDNAASIVARWPRVWRTQSAPQLRPFCDRPAFPC